MLVLDASPRTRERTPSPSAGGDTETEDEDEDEAITPNVSAELLPSFLGLLSPGALGGRSKAPKPAQGEDMEAAMALLGFMGPETKRGLVETDACVSPGTDRSV